MINPAKLKAQIEANIDEPYGKPTDIIGFNKELADTIAPVVSHKEICYFDEDLRFGSEYHYLDFPDMLEKTEIMIINHELAEKYYPYLPKLNKNVKIFIHQDLHKTIAALEKAGFKKNMLYCI